MPRTPLRSRPAQRAPFEPLVADSYLTDGLRLFRVMSWTEVGADHIRATLENCMTLEVRAYSPRELDLMCLSLVRAAATN